jgi:hypothetical protein
MRAVCIPTKAASSVALQKRVRAVLKRAKAAIGKRHTYIHSLWAVNEFRGPPVGRISFPKGSGGEVPLEELTDLVCHFRQLIEEVEPLMEEIQKVRGLGYRSLHDLEKSSP